VPKFPSRLNVVLGLLAGSGWWMALAGHRKERIERRDRQDIIQEIVSQKRMRNEVPVQIEASPAPQSSERVESCLQDPSVQHEVEAQAKAWAAEISNEVLEEYQEEQRQEKMEQASQRMDVMQDVFTNAVDAYAEEFDVEPMVSEQLHGIVEGGFERQRALFQQHSEGELSSREYRTLRNEARADGKASVLDLLGEEGVKDFGQFVQEEGERVREEVARREQEQD